MDRELLIRLGESLYGKNWKLPFAKAHGYSERTVRRWARGSFRIPPGVADHLRRLAADRRDELRELERLTEVD